MVARRGVAVLLAFAELASFSGFRLRAFRCAACGGARGAGRSVTAPRAARSELDELPAGLPPVPDPAVDPADNVLRSLQETWPLPAVQLMRDSGIVGWLSDVSVILGLPSLFRAYPSALRRFLRLSGWVWTGPGGGEGRTRLQTVSYGPHPKQIVDVLEGTAAAADPSRLVVICHGGAWGSGRPWMYRLAAEPFLASGCRVAIWGYRTYPDGGVDEQVDDLQHTMAVLQERFPSRERAILAHSSGAHVALLASLQRYREEGAPLCDALVLLSGVYDIPCQYEWERRRGVHEISQMKPACGGGLEEWLRVSPTRHVPPKRHGASLPPTLLLHGATDGLAPYTHSVNMTRALRRAGFLGDGVELQVLPGAEHADTIVHCMVGGETLEAVGAWMRRHFVRGR